jgi:hypothetical protein
MTRWSERSIAFSTPTGLTGPENSSRTDASHTLNRSSRFTS